MTEPFTVCDKKVTKDSVISIIKVSMLLSYSDSTENQTLMKIIPEKSNNKNSSMLLNDYNVFGVSKKVFFPA